MINVTRTKSLSAIHTKNYAEELRLNPPRVLSLTTASSSCRTTNSSR